MKQRIILYIKTFFMFTLLLILLVPVFMLYNHTLFQVVSFKGYLSVVSSVIIVVSIWCKSRPIRIAQTVYYVIIALIIPLIYMVDMVLYGYWGFRLDTTPLFYFFTSPKDAFASVSIWFVIFGFIIYFAVAFLLFLLFHRILIKDVA